MNDRGKSDGLVVPLKLPNKPEVLGAEVMEGRRPAKGNQREQNDSRTPSREGEADNALARVRLVAEQKKGEQFTSLMHMIYDVERLRRAYHATRRDAASGVDGETWKSYGESLEENLRDLSGRLARGGYRAKPARRVFIPKADGKLRPLGIPALEDKIVQRSAVEVLNAIYEADFLRISYGFRPGRSAHNALDALAVAIQTGNVNWVLDADIRSFFDTLDHGWLVQFLRHRIRDERVIRLIQKWLRAGVLTEEGKRERSEMGTVQGGSISPLLANIYLHYVYDLWIRAWRQTQAHGQVVVVRYADDFVMGFEHRSDAERCQAELADQLSRYGLTLHSEKTRLIAFGRNADRAWRAGTGAKPATFDFLGFTHTCGQTRRGRFVVIRRTSKKRMRRKLEQVKQKLKRNMHKSIAVQGQYLRSVLQGHVRYYGVPFNSRALSAFRCALVRLWHRILCRRSQRSRMPQHRFAPIVTRWLPTPHICHPYPSLARVATT